MKKNPTFIYSLIRFLESGFFWMAFTVDSIYFVQNAHLDPFQLVLVGTTIEIAILIFELPTGVMADLFSRKWSVTLGYFLIGAGFLVQGSFPAFLPILLAQIIWGLGITFTSGALEAWITDEIGEEKAGQAFLRGAQMKQIGGVSGIIIGSLIGLVGLALPIIVSAVFFMLLAVYLSFSMPESGFQPDRSANHSPLGQLRETIQKSIKLVRVHPALLSILGAGFFYGLYSEGFDRLWVANLLEQFTFFGLPTVIWFGIINAVAFLLSAFSLEFIKKLFDFSNRRTVIKLLLYSSSLLFISLVLFSLSRILWLAILFYWLITVFREINYPLFITWLNKKLDSSIRATIISTVGQVDAIGQIAGGPGIGWIARRTSIPVGMICSAILLLPVLPLILGQLKQPENQ